MRETFDPAKRGYSVSYRVGKTTAPPPCPGCGRTNWLVGRKTAECAFCGLALPLEGEIR